MMLDIEESGQVKSFAELSENALRAERRPEGIGTVRGLDRANVTSKRDKIAIQAIDRLGGVYRPLRATRTADEVQLVLWQMRQTYAGSFKPREVVVLISCRYYLRRLTRR